MYQKELTSKTPLLLSLVCCTLWSESNALIDCEFGAPLKIDLKTKVRKKINFNMVTCHSHSLDSPSSPAFGSDTFADGVVEGLIGLVDTAVCGLRRDREGASLCLCNGFDRSHFIAVRNVQVVVSVLGCSLAVERIEAHLFIFFQQLLQ